MSAAIEMMGCLTETAKKRNVGALQRFVKDLQRLGFGGDESINGADTVDAVNEHFDDLVALTQPREAT